MAGGPMQKIDASPRAKLGPPRGVRLDIGTQSIVTGLMLGCALVVLALAARNWPATIASEHERSIQPFARDVCNARVRATLCLPPDFSASDVTRVYNLPPDVAARVRVDGAGTIRFDQDK
jgi:hypothetical protein